MGRWTFEKINYFLWKLYQTKSFFDAGSFYNNLSEYYVWRYLSLSKISINQSWNLDKTYHTHVTYIPTMKHKTYRRNTRRNNETTFKVIVNVKNVIIIK